jgi:hypothetical protein
VFLPRDDHRAVFFGAVFLFHVVSHYCPVNFDSTTITS